MYDDEGRLTGWVTTTETEWDEQQQGWMVALAAWRNGQCRRCGGDLAQTTHPDNEGRYKPQLPVRCHRCTSLAISEEAYRKQSHPQALIHQVELKPPRRPPTASPEPQRP